VLLPGSVQVNFGIPVPRTGQTTPAMQAKQLLASGGVTMAAGAMISLSFAVSPPLTLLPPLPVPTDANGDVASQIDQTAETVGAAIADSFRRRWQAADDICRRVIRSGGLIGGVLPLTQDLPRSCGSFVWSPLPHAPTIGLTQEEHRQKPVRLFPASGRFRGGHPCDDTGPKSCPLLRRSIFPGLDAIGQNLHRCY
jgi:hypothetical protein